MAQKLYKAYISAKDFDEDYEKVKKDYESDN